MRGVFSGLSNSSFREPGIVVVEHSDPIAGSRRCEPLFHDWFKILSTQDYSGEKRTWISGTGALIKSDDATKETRTECESPLRWRIMVRS